MSTSTGTWAEEAEGRLREAGFRRGGARLAVIELLEEQTCALNALEIEDALKARGNAVGRASIYRALDQLEELGLLRRLEVSKGTTSYEPVGPAGHHHHIVCDDCGKVVPFEDPKLEKVISALETDTDFTILEHEVTLRGHCKDC